MAEQDITVILVLVALLTLVDKVLLVTPKAATILTITKLMLLLEQVAVVDGDLVIKEHMVPMVLSLSTNTPK